MAGSTILFHNPHKQSLPFLVKAVQTRGHGSITSNAIRTTRDLIRSNAISCLVVTAEHYSDVRDTVIAGVTVPVVVLCNEIGGNAAGASIDIACDPSVDHYVVAPFHELGGDVDTKAAAVAEDIACAISHAAQCQQFSLRSYLPPAQTHQREVHDIRAREAAIRALEADLNGLQLGRHFIRVGLTTAEALMTHALSQRQHSKAKKSRPPRLLWGTHEQRFVLIADDPYGTLGRDLVARGLLDSVAGECDTLLGSVIASAQETVIYNQPGVNSRIVAVFDLQKHSDRAGQVQVLSIPSATSAASPVFDGSVTSEVHEQLRLELQRKLFRWQKQTADRDDRFEEAEQEFSYPMAQGTGQIREIAPFACEGISLDRAVHRLGQASDPSAAVESVLHFLAGDNNTAVAYAAKDDCLAPCSAAGRIYDWPQLGSLQLKRSSSSSLTKVATTGKPAAMEVNRMLIDRRIASLALSTPSPKGIAVPVTVDDNVRYVLCVFASCRENLPTSRQIVVILAELSASLLRCELSKTISAAAGGDNSVANDTGPGNHCPAVSGVIGS